MKSRESDRRDLPRRPNVHLRDFLFRLLRGVWRTASFFVGSLVDIAGERLSGGRTCEGADRRRNGVRTRGGR